MADPPYKTLPGKAYDTWLVNVSREIIESSRELLARTTPSVATKPYDPLPSPTRKSELREMPLVIGLRKGQEFSAGDQRFVVDQVRAEDDFTLVGPDGQTHFITAHGETEILPGVFVMAGERRERGLVARIAIRAPKEVKVSRGDRPAALSKGP